MTESDFWDKFNRKHNPNYYYGKQEKTKEGTKTKNKDKTSNTGSYPNTPRGQRADYFK